MATLWRNCYNWGVYILVTLVVLYFGAVSALAFGVNRPTLQSFNQYDRSPYIQVPDPISAELHGVLPSATSLQAPPNASIRAIVVEPTAVNLMAGGVIVRHIPVAVTDLPELVAQVHDTDWIASQGTTVSLSAGLVLEHVPRFTIGEPVTAVALQDTPGVFIGADGSGLNFEHVSVAAVSPQGGPAGPSPHGQDYRPFVVAKQGSALTASGSTFTNLGYDWNGSYGVSWMDHSTGGSSASQYIGGFIGVYTDHVSGLTFRGDVYRGNVLYGIDPHSSSSQLVITGCTATGNGGHGIIFSDHVTASYVTGCTSSLNGENGIMMDKFSSGNTVTGNTVQNNRGDGIVLSNSADNTVLGNIVADNRVGITVSADSRAHLVIQNNVLEHNVAAAQGVQLASTNAQSENGGQIVPLRFEAISAATVAVLGACLALTFALRRRRTIA